MRRDRSEDILHRAIVKRLSDPLCGLAPPWMLWHTPNSGIRRGQNPAAFGAYMKAMGLRAGVPDLFVLGPGPILVGLEIKAPAKILKSGKKSKAKPAVSDAQEETHLALAACGVATIIVRDVDDALAALSTLGATLRGRSR